MALTSTPNSYVRRSILSNIRSGYHYGFRTSSYKQVLAHQQRAVRRHPKLSRPTRGYSITLTMQPLSLLVGWPSPHLLPATFISHAARSALADPSISTPGLSYGPDEGFEPLRRALATWLSQFYEQKDLPFDRLVITGGASQNIGCTLQVFTDPGFTEDVLLVAPSYMMIYPTFLDNGFEGRLVAVPEDEMGLDVGCLRERLVESERRRAARGEVKLFKPKRSYSKYYRHIIYCVPTFSNPSSRIMSYDRRIELVRIAREFDALIISDDVYDQLQWPANPNGLASVPMKTAVIPRLVDIDKTLDGGYNRPGADGFGNAMSNGSFSKICGPGVRVGWAEGSPKLAFGISQCGTSTSGGAPSQLTSTFMTKMLEGGVLQKHIYETLQPAYASRYATVMKAVRQYLVPHGVELPQPDRSVIGGYFIWFKLPSGLSATEYARICKADANVAILAGPRFEIPGDPRIQFPHHVRLCFSWIDEDLIEEAVKRIGVVLGDLIIAETIQR